MENQPEWALLARYVSGECSPAEERRVEAWMRADPARQQLVEELRSIWGAVETGPRRPGLEMDLDEEWEEMQAKMSSSESPAGDDEPARERRAPSTRARPSRRRVPSWVVGAASAVLLLACAWLAQALGWGTSATETETYREVVTKKGERSRLQLADGSTVMLNVDSRLRLPSSFARKRRVVHLTGEAYFEVETDSTRPFIVRTGTASVRVRGTAFNVRGYPDEQRVAVAVAEGGVSVRPRKDDGEPEAVTLHSGEVGWMAETDTTIRTATADLDSYLGWTEGRLVFENTPLPEVAQRLERWYGMTFKIRDPALRSLRLTANLKSQAVENVLDVIAASLDLRYRIDGNTVVLEARSAPR